MKLERKVTQSDVSDFKAPEGERDATVFKGRIFSFGRHETSKMIANLIKK
jgi:hypothetical protein